ncbi:hypothetical protein LTS18_005549 [Coniosporium uncinatum]|uniref:Uncharacterized protein n=1 Tax=Coniosporium uncinatum TaxID=93489 RepID=A0ACC3DRA9_9PEZI|nr:hypothetical protein LTS18_005549 [Coniosporium uncinatum]
MLRNPASRAILRSFANVGAKPARPMINGALQRPQLASQLCTLSSKRPQRIAVALNRSVTATFQRHASSAQPPHFDKVNTKAEDKLAHQKLEAHPELVSSTSSIHPLNSEIGVQEQEKEVDMLAGMRSDLRTIAETFSLQDVPRQAYVLGLAGVMPYLATSLSTVYCAWEINHAAATGSGLLMSERSAELLLHILEPLQIGYGAVIISFLGAIHWGLEWAGYGGYHGYPRYAIGVIAPAVAWPSILFPVEYALISQFLAFNFLYYADTRAAVRGWTPPWYGTYRFVLTFIVGASIVVSLIGRGQIADRVGKLPGPADRIKEFRESAAEALSKDEKAKRTSMVKGDEE